MKDIILQAYGVLKAVYSEGAYLKIALGNAKIAERDRAAVTKMCYGVLENDALLSYKLKFLSPRSAKLPVRIIIKSGMYAAEYLKKQIYAVTDACVEAVKAIGKRENAGFVNAVLRRFAAEKIPMSEDERERLCLEYSFPLSAFRTLEREYGRERAEAVTRFRGANNCVRFKRGSNGERYLAEKRVVFEKTAVPEVFFVKNFGGDSGFYDGKYTYQSLGSAAICEMIEGGERLLDACAAPGGKSVNLAEKFTEVVACELHPHRKSLIESYASRMKVDNVRAEVRDSAVYNPEFENAFDAVLCDVPCSGFGVLSENPDIKLRADERKPEVFCDIQFKILNNCARYVKRGGFLYYSTCTLFKGENSGVVKKFLSENSGYELCEATSPLTGVSDTGIQFFPDMSCGAGFYFCKLKRVR